MAGCRDVPALTYPFVRDITHAREGAGAAAPKGERRPAAEAQEASMPFSPATAYSRFVRTVHELEAAGLDREAAQALRDVADARLFATAPDDTLIADAEATC